MQNRKGSKRVVLSSPRCPLFSDARPVETGTPPLLSPLRPTRLQLPRAHIMSKENEKGSIKERESISEDGKGQDTLKANIKLANPLVGIPHEQLEADAVEFAKSHGLGHLEDEFRKGALIAQDPLAFESLAQLSEEDKVILRRELTNRWDQPLQLYYLVIMCSLAAAVQGVSSASAVCCSLSSDHRDRWTSR